MGVLFKRMRAELGVADKKLSAVVEVAEAAPQSAIRQRMNRTTGRNRSPLKHNFRLKQSTGDPSRDSKQLSLSNEDAHDRRLAELRKIDRAAVADPCSSLRTGSDGRKLRQNQSRMNKQIVRIGRILFPTVRLI